MEVTPAHGSLCAYVRMRPGTVGHTHIPKKSGVRVYSELHEERVPLPGRQPCWVTGEPRAFELIHGQTPSYLLVSLAFQLDEDERRMLSKLWPEIIDGHAHGSIQ
jgi:hypothetical protein